MTASLTPALALAYLHELSVGVRAAVVLDAAGEPLAGDSDLAGRVERLLAPPDGAAAAPAPAVRAVAAEDGSLLLARTPDEGAIAVLTGPFALLALLEHDLAGIAQVLVTGRSNLPGSRDSPS